VDSPDCIGGVSVAATGASGCTCRGSVLAAASLTAVAPADGATGTPIPAARLLVGGLMEDCHQQSLLEQKANNPKRTLLLPLLIDCRPVPSGALPAFDSAAGAVAAD
jgi:hypothetical protein